MNGFDNIINTADTTVKGWLSYVDQNEYVTAGLALFLIVYASYAAPRLPPYILRLFDNPLFKLVIFFLIVYSARKNPTVAIIAAIGVMVTLHALNKLKLEQMMTMQIQKDKVYSDLSENIDQNLIPDDIAYEEASRHNEMIPSAALVDIQDEQKEQPQYRGHTAQPCVQKEKYRNNFYPQYVNMTTDAYEAKAAGSVYEYDPQTQYASI